MKEDKAVRILEDYARPRGLPWGPIVRAGIEPAWWNSRSVRAWLIESQSVTGVLKGRVVAKNGEVAECGFEPFPRDENGWLLPLWIAFPGTNSVTMFWRMGSGETYKYVWHGWWRTLSAEQKVAYRTKYPEPTLEDLVWQGFYDDIAEKPSNGSIGDFISGRV